MYTREGERARERQRKGEEGVRDERRKETEIYTGDEQNKKEQLNSIKKKCVGGVKSLLEVRNRSFISLLVKCFLFIRLYFIYEKTNWREFKQIKGYGEYVCGCVCV